MTDLVRGSAWQRVLEPFLVIKIVFRMGVFSLEAACHMSEVVCGLHQLSSRIAAFEIDETWRCNRAVRMRAVGEWCEVE